MRRRNRNPSHLAAGLGVSHATVSRWLSGTDIPNPKSCRKLSEYSGIPVNEIFSIAGHLHREESILPVQLPEFREYAKCKYPAELDEDFITMIEDLIERRRVKNYDNRKNK